jgi:mono/diheme cytochrome c family protein
MEEGIRQFNNCVECHGSGNKHDIKGGKASKEGKRGKREDD